MSNWPPGVSDGLTLPCSNCGKFTNIDFRATPESWSYVTEFIGDKTSVICLDCFTEALNRSDRNPAECIVEIQIIGKGSTLVFRKPELIIWPRDEEER